MNIIWNNPVLVWCLFDVNEFHLTINRFQTASKILNSLVIGYLLGICVLKKCIIPKPSRISRCRWMCWWWYSYTPSTLCIILSVYWRKLPNPNNSIQDHVCHSETLPIAYKFKKTSNNKNGKMPAPSQPVALLPPPLLQPMPLTLMLELSQKFKVLKVP